MMDFNVMVRNILFENSPPVEGGTEEQQEKLYREGLSNYIKQKFTDLQTAFAKQYGATNKFIQESEIIGLVTNVAYGAGKTRSAGYNKDQVEEIFPLYDFVAYLYENLFKGKQTPPENILNESFKKFTETLEKSSKIPLEFPAMSTWGKNVKEDYTQLSKQEIGKIKFEALPEYLTFWGAIKSLLECYEKAKFHFLPPSLKGIKPLNSIEKVFADPNIAATGKFTFNDEKMNSLYDALSKSTITNVAIAAYRLYMHQIKSNVTDENQIKSLLLSVDKFQEFMGIQFPVEKAQEMSWENSVTESTLLSNIAYSQSMSFNEAFELLSRHLLNEATPEELRRAAERASRPEVRALSVQTPNAELASGATEETSTGDSATETTPAALLIQFAVESKPGTFVYDLENLKKPSQIPEVKTFIKALQGLADKLKTSSSFNIDVAGAAKALSLGARDIGS